jgi:hypothetical protein
MPSGVGGVAVAPLSQQGPQACDLDGLCGEDGCKAPRQRGPWCRCGGRRGLLTCPALQPIREPVQRAGKLVSLDEGSLGIKPAGEAKAADAAGESTELRGGRRGPADARWDRRTVPHRPPGGRHQPLTAEAPAPDDVRPPQVDRFTCPAGDRVTSVTSTTTWF